MPMMKPIGCYLVTLVSSSNVVPPVQAQGVFGRHTYRPTYIEVTVVNLSQEPAHIWAGALAWKGIRGFVPNWWRRPWS